MNYSETALSLGKCGRPKDKRKTKTTGASNETDVVNGELGLNFVLW